jgi:hypothetical protein
MDLYEQTHWVPDLKAMEETAWGSWTLRRMYTATAIYPFDRTAMSRVEIKRHGAKKRRHNSFGGSMRRIR